MMSSSYLQTSSHFIGSDYWQKHWGLWRNFKTQLTLQGYGTGQFSAAKVTPSNTFCRLRRRLWVPQLHLSDWPQTLPSWNSLFASEFVECCRSLHSTYWRLGVRHQRLLVLKSSTVSDKSVTSHHLWAWPLAMLTGHRSTMRWSCHHSWQTQGTRSVHSLHWVAEITTDRAPLNQCLDQSELSWCTYRLYSDRSAVSAS